MSNLINPYIGSGEVLPKLGAVEPHQGAFRAAILSQLGHSPEHITAGKLMRFSTNGQRGDRAGWCKLFADGLGGVFGDWRSGRVSTWHVHDRRRLNMTERAAWHRQVEQARQEHDRLQRQEWVKNSERNARLWASCCPLQPGDPAMLYLRHRLQADPGLLPACLRLHPGLGYWHEGTHLGNFPALVSAFTSPTGELLALHRVYLSDGGGKADVPVVKKLTSVSGPLNGGCIRLARPAASGVIGIAEGLETALAASMASGLPVVSASSANALASWIWPSGVRSLVIFADADDAGRAAALRLQQRATAAAIRVSVMLPSTEGADWCDVWAERDALRVSQIFDGLHAFEPAQLEGSQHE